jgi:hypothetical protein
MARRFAGRYLVTDSSSSINFFKSQYAPANSKCALVLSGKNVMLDVQCIYV